MPFGLKNAPETIQSAIDVSLISLRWKYVLVYLNDMGVFFKPTADHIGQVTCVLQVIYLAGVTLKLKSASCSLKNSTTWTTLSGPATSNWGNAGQIMQQDRKTAQGRQSCALYYAYITSLGGAYQTLQVTPLPSIKRWGRTILKLSSHWIKRRVPRLPHYKWHSTSHQ